MKAKADSGVRRPGFFLSPRLFSSALAEGRFLVRTAATLGESGWGVRFLISLRLCASVVFGPV
jgi:hypothetical protein